MDVKAKVEKLIRKHKTNDPFEIAKQENIHIIYINLGGKFGNYIKYKREKFSASSAPTNSDTHFAHRRKIRNG